MALAKIVYWANPKRSIFIFNPLDKVIELYKRLVLAEKEKVENLERLLKK